MALQIRTEELREEARVGRIRAQNVGTDSMASVTSCGDHSTPALPNVDSVIDQLTNDLMSGLDLMKLKIQVHSTPPPWVSDNYYSSHLNTWIPDSSEYQTVWVSGIQMVKSCDLVVSSGHFRAFYVVFFPLEYIPTTHSITITGHFGLLTGFFQSGFQTTIQIWQPDTNLLFEFQTSTVFRWLQ